MSIDKALTEALEIAIDKTLQRVGGPLFGSVQSYTPSTARAAVQPLVPIWVDGEVVRPPKLHSVPVCWPRSSGHGIHFPLAAGDFVELVPLGHDHSSWVTTGTPNAPPPSTRRVSLSDLVAIPIAPAPKALPPSSALYDAAWGVLAGMWKIGSSAAAKAVGLDGDAVDKYAPPMGGGMAGWMTLVETACNAAAPGTFTPATSHTAFTRIGTLQASATKLKAE